MSGTPERDRNLIALAATVCVFALFVVVYVLPRTAELRRTRDSITQLTKSRQELAILVPQVALTAINLPEPEPNVRAWITAQAFKGLDQAKQVSVNDGYLEGKGAKVKLRKLEPAQAAQFLSQLTRVRLVVERMVLQDADGDGFWDLEIDVKVPQLP